MVTISFLKASERTGSFDRWAVRGKTRSGGVDGELVLFGEELSELSATDLKNALRSEARGHGKTSEARVASVPAGYLEEDGPYEPIWFSWEGETLMVRVSFLVPWPEDGQEAPAVRAVTRLVEPLLRQTRSQVVEVTDDPWWTSSTELGMQVAFQPLLRARTVKEIFDIGADALRLCRAFGDGAIERATVADVVRGGGAHLLVGQPEGNWLDVKSQEYRLETLGGKISLAQAVARFCNAEEGGLIVIGAHARKVPGGEIITSVRGLPVTAGTHARYLRVLNQHLYPLPSHLRIDVVEVEVGRSLIVIDVPAQPEESKPFLVQGAIRADGQTEGAFISIVQRRGEESVPITAQMIHTMLAAGRALLRGNLRS